MKYGSIICVSVIENSTNTKARGIATRELQVCVESCGLNGIGKKGIQVTAKSFSDENLPENKALFLDLIEVIISKMNGDTNKYFKICGPPLSKKAKDTIEARMTKSDSSASKTTPRQPDVKRVPSSSGRRSIAPTDSRATTPPEPISSHQAELPALNLKSTENTMHQSKSNRDVDGPFRFSFNSGESATSPSSVGMTKVPSEELLSKREASSGAAASLRERLRQIRDKHKQDGDSATDASFPEPPSERSGSASNIVVVPCPLYDDIIKTVETLLGELTPLVEIDDKFTNGLIGLRQLHSSLSNSHSDSTGTDPKLLQELRLHVENKVPDCVKILTRYVNITFLIADQRECFAFESF